MLRGQLATVERRFRRALNVADRRSRAGSVADWTDKVTGRKRAPFQSFTVISFPHSRQGMAQRQRECRSIRVEALDCAFQFVKLAQHAGKMVRVALTIIGNRCFFDHLYLGY